MLQEEIEEILDEAGFGRIIDATKNKDYAIISAFRGNLSLDQNLERNDQLLKKLKDSGHGVHKLSGHWAGGSENSFFVIRNKAISPGEFEETIIDLGNDFNQDAILLKIGPNTEYVNLKTNERTSLSGNVALNATGDNYSQYAKKLDTPFAID